MPEPTFTALSAAVSSIWTYIKWPITQIVSAFRLNAKVAELEDKLRKIGEQPAAPSPYRKCPKCKERDFRLEDRYRYHSDVFSNQRYLHEKWRCYSCGFMEDANLPEPGG
jgi:hypothetical protein